MKKIIGITALILSVVMMMTLFTCCGKQEEEKLPTEIIEDGPSTIVGGWQKADSPVITEEFQKVFDKATEALAGEEFTPVAYIASQVVAGKNHCVLCKATATVPDAESVYALVYIYEDLQGNAEITEIKHSDADASFYDVDGSWQKTDTPEVTDEAKKVFESAASELTGATLTPLGLLATQVVSGTNYCFVCEQIATVPNPEASYVIAYVYASLDGKTEITEIKEFKSETEEAAEQSSEEFAVSQANN